MNTVEGTTTQKFNDFQAEKPARVPIRRYFICLIFLALSFSVKAQFLYLGTRLGYEATLYKINYDAITAHNSFKWNIALMWRPARRLGIGVTVGIPIIQGTRFSFGDSPTPDESSFYNFKSSSSDSRVRYEPAVYDYDFFYGNSYTLNLRYFIAVEPDFYLDFNVTKIDITERFKMLRTGRAPQYENILNSIQYGAVEVVNFYYRTEHSLLIPGLGIGYMPNVSKRLKLDFHFGLGFLKITEDPFVFRVSHDWDIVNDKTEYVDLTGQTKGMKTVLNFNLGLNYSL